MLPAPVTSHFPSRHPGAGTLRKVVVLPGLSSVLISGAFLPTDHVQSKSGERVLRDRRRSPHPRCAIPRLLLHHQSLHTHQSGPEQEQTQVCCVRACESAGGKDIQITQCPFAPWGEGELENYSPLLCPTRSLPRLFAFPSCLSSSPPCVPLNTLCLLWKIFTRPYCWFSMVYVELCGNLNYICWAF